MFDRTFNPGPSQVSDDVKADIITATKQNIVSISHRSPEFLDITKKAVDGLRQFFEVPEDYHILFTSSATETMELVIRNLVQKESFHFTNGHFSELFERVSQSFGKQTKVNSVEWGSQNDFQAATIPRSTDIVTVTYNETSTGVICDQQTLGNLRKKLTDQILVVDITSTAGCVPLTITDGDVWLFSVQKGLGLPSGLGVLFVSPNAMEQSRDLHHAGLFNFGSMAEAMSQHQTLHTPNVLGIYLLSKQLERWNKVGAASQYEATRAKAKLLQDFIEAHDSLNYFVQEPSARSEATVCIAAQPEIIAHMHDAAKKAGLIIGAGYGKLKNTTCRIATFPALTVSDVQKLIDVLAPIVE